MHKQTPNKHPVYNATSRVAALAECKGYAAIVCGARRGAALLGSLCVEQTRGWVRAGVEHTVAGI